jgi:hypothetical protein
LFSEQFKDEIEIFYLERGIEPFKAVLELPPDHRKIFRVDKFDVN